MASRATRLNPRPLAGEMTDRDHPYKDLEATPLWRRVETAIEHLEANRDFQITTAREYVVGYICQSVGPTQSCRCCIAKQPISDQRVCPECGHEFKGSGWDGIDAHWRSKHETITPYKQFWRTMCPEHLRGRAS